MYGAELVLGARSLEAVEQALREVLPALGLSVTEAALVANVSELWERRGHEASLSIGAVSDGIFAVSLRGPHDPAWHRALARRLSHALCGWVACSDRQYAYFLDGMAVEDAAGAETLELVAGPYVTPWPPSGSIRVLFVEGEASVTADLVRSPSTLVVVAGHSERIDLPGYEYDLEEVRVHVARTLLPLAELAVLLKATDGVALVTNEDMISDLRSVLEAWEPVCSRTRTAPMAFTFDARSTKSPWR